MGADGDVRLREVIASDLPVFFAHQCEPEAVRMAAFAVRDRDAFMAHWAKVLRDPSVITRTILCDGQVVGNIVCFAVAEEYEVGYWVGADHWGKGIASRALVALLEQVQRRPLYAHVALHNVASRRVLEKCRFVVCGTESGAQGEEYILRLNACS